MPKIIQRQLSYGEIQFNKRLAKEQRIKDSKKRYILRIPDINFNTYSR